MRECEEGEEGETGASPQFVSLERVLSLWVSASFSEHLVASSRSLQWATSSTILGSCVPPVYSSNRIAPAIGLLGSQRRGTSRSRIGFRGSHSCRSPEPTAPAAQCLISSPPIWRRLLTLTQTLKELAAGQSYIVTEAEGTLPIKTPQPERTLFVELLMPNLPRHVESDFDDFAVQPLLPNRLSTEGPAMAWGDLAGNGCFLGGASGHPAQLWLQSDKGRLFRQRIPFFDDDALHEDVEAHPNPDGNRDDIATTSRRHRAKSCQIVAVAVQAEPCPSSRKSSEHSIASPPPASQRYIRCQGFRVQSKATN